MAYSESNQPIPRLIISSLDVQVAYPQVCDDASIRVVIDRHDHALLSSDDRPELVSGLWAKGLVDFGRIDAGESEVDLDSLNHYDQRVTILDADQGAEKCSLIARVSGFGRVAFLFLVTVPFPGFRLDVAPVLGESAGMPLHRGRKTQAEDSKYERKASFNYC